MSLTKFFGNVATFVCFAFMIFVIFVAVTGTKTGETTCNNTTSSIIDYSTCRINHIS